MLISYVSQFMTLLPGDVISPPAGRPPESRGGRTDFRYAFFTMATSSQLGIAGLGESRPEAGSHI